jgi:hypothetical protein
LADLNLAGTQATDVGAALFQGCTNLATFNLQRTKVTAKKIAELKKALPKCKIIWDGGVIGSKTNVDHDGDLSPLARAFSSCYPVRIGPS